MLKKTIKIIDKAISRNCFVIFLSSNAVFEGSKPYYKYFEKVKPINNYGLFKSQVEKFIISSSKNYACILRLTKVISNKSSFILNWEKDLKEKGYCKVF